MNWKNNFPKENRYFETSNGILYCADVFDLLTKFPKESIDLVLTDPPYGINKTKWDHFKSRNMYVKFILNCFKQIEKIMKINATFYWFHLDMEVVSEIMVKLKQETKLKFIQFIVWNKRFEGCKNKDYLDGFLKVSNLNTFPTMAEYILKYRIDLGKILKERREKLGISQFTISKELKSKTGGITGWYSNIETNKYLPNRKTIKPIEKYLGFKLEDLLPIFNNQKTHHSVWNYDFDNKKIGHITPKPESLIENILIHSSRKKDLVLDCFVGSGTTCVVAEKLNRRWIGIEINPDYCEIAKQRIVEFLKQPKRKTLL